MQKSKTQIKNRKPFLQTISERVANPFQFRSLWPFGVIFFVWFIFSSPYLLHGKVPFPGDSQQYSFSPWDSYIVKGPIKNPALTDVIVQMYPWKHFTIDSLQHGIIPFWNPYSFSGTTHLANYQSAVFTPFNLLFFIFPFVDAWAFLILFQPLLAGVFMYMFVRSLKISHAGSLTSAIGFMFCGFMTVWMAWGTLGYAILFLPLALLAIENFYETSSKRFCLLLSSVIPLSFFSGHFQTSLYFLIFIVAYIIYKWFITKKIRITIYLILYIFFGLLITIPQVLPSVQVYLQSLRSTISSKSEAIPWNYLPTLLAPDFYGNPVTRNDWFGHYAEWNGYIGLVPLLLSFYVVMKKKKSQTLFFLITGILWLFLAYATPLLDVLTIFHVPILFTSAASRIIVLFSFSILVLAGFGLDQLMQDIKEKHMKSIAILLCIFGGIFSSLWVMVLEKMFLPIDKIMIAKQNLLLPTILFGGIGFSILITIFIKYRLVSKQNDKLQRICLYFISYCLILISIFDMLRFSTKWMPFLDKHTIFTSSPLTNVFHPNPSYERVFGNYGGEMSTYFYLPSVDGYDAVYLKRYGEFISYVNHSIPGESEKSLVVLSKTAPLTERAMDLLNVRYIIHKISDGHVSWTFPFWSFPEGQFDIVYKDNNYEVYRNNVALPRAFLVGSYAVKQNPSDILSTIFADNFAARREVVVEEDPKISPSLGEVGSATITKYLPNNVTVETDAKAQELLFLSDAYYPDWEARVDGNLTKIYRANYAFRAVKVPVGKHKVEFVYYERGFVWGFWLSLIGILGIIIFSRMPVR